MREARLPGTWSPEGRAFKTEGRATQRPWGRSALSVRRSSGEASEARAQRGRPMERRVWGEVREQPGAWIAQVLSAMVTMRTLTQFEIGGPLEGSKQRNGLTRFES